MQQNNRKEPYQWINKIAWFFAGVSIVIMVGFMLFLPFNDWSWQADATLFSQYGEFIAGVAGPLLSFSAFLMVYRTLKLQKETLDEQKVSSDKDRQLSSEEQFKTTFFALLQRQRDIAKEVFENFSVFDKAQLTPMSIHAAGVDYFKQAMCQLYLIYNTLDSGIFPSDNYDKLWQDWWKKESNPFSSESARLSTDNRLHEEFENAEKDEERERIKVCNAYIFNLYDIEKDRYEKYEMLDMPNRIEMGYKVFFSRYDNTGYYFRHLYHILKFVKGEENKRLNATTDKRNRKEIRKYYAQYAEFLQSEMSATELAIVFYNASAFPRMKELIVHFNFLENLPVKYLVKPEHDCLGIKIRTEEDNDDFLS
jgi:hypothetical protein